MHISWFFILIRCAFLSSFARFIFGSGLQPSDLNIAKNCISDKKLYEWQKWYQWQKMMSVTKNDINDKKWYQWQKIISVTKYYISDKNYISDKKDISDKK